MVPLSGAAVGRVVSLGGYILSAWADGSVVRRSCGPCGQPGRLYTVRLCLMVPLSGVAVGPVASLGSYVLSACVS